MDIRNEFKKAIKDKNMAVSDLAKTDIKPQTLYAIIKHNKENQKDSPDILERSANALDISPLALISPADRKETFTAEFF